ncbi:hypothetical protein [Roseibium sp. RKSG952]|uniref:hypothetical protein n=1 Tax=Roseibium sp. RKSG952 TaxID=2529384 RepID=UPI0012BCF618|nr:hypothetical protein [Roseibium sp. RKSG952]MTI03636.1 hypothetical protein [Roseibium sp. RKSG952]
MRRFALILAIWPGFLAADEFRQLTGDEILTALTGQKLVYTNGAWQTFDDTMLTQYFSGRPSAGHWAVRDDQYCSLWPPSDLWACYTVQQSGDTIRFVGEGGDLTDGTYEN